MAMKVQRTPFETWMHNQVKKQKNIEDQQILDLMMAELKKKYEAEKQQKLEELVQKMKGMEV